MPKTRTLELNFHPDGSVSTEAHGFQGKGCSAALKPFHDALGVVTASKKKPEYHQQQSHTTTGHQIQST